MKKIFNSLMALAIAGLTFTACEDVPLPYQNPNENQAIDQPAEETADEILNIDFLAGQNGWLIVDVKKAEGGDVWSADAKYGMKATAYISGTNYASESWLISPTLDFSSLTNGVLNIHHAANYFATTCDADCSVMVSTDYASGDPSKATWTKVNIDTWPTSWTFVDGKGSLSAVEGKSNVRIGFRYTSDAKAGTWEVDRLTVTGNGSASSSGGGDTLAPSTGATIAQFNAAAESNDVWYQLTGTVSGFKDSDLYGNFDLVDATGTVYVYGLLSEKGGDKKLFQELAAAKGIKEGSKITIIGNRGSYNGKIEVMNAYFVSIDNGTTPSNPTPDTPATKGDGTLANPFSPAEANAYVAAMAADVTSDNDIYVKGKIIEITDKNQFSTQYGNCTFYISDDGTDKDDKFYVFRTLYLGNVKYTEGPLPKAGDEVIICGKVVNYKGNTPETSANNSYIYSLNGKTSAEEEKPSEAGSAANPFTVAQAIAKCIETGETKTEQEFYAKGKISSIKEVSVSYGNATFNISDDGKDENFVTVYRAYSIDKENFASEDEIKVGDEVIIVGQLVNYKGNTPEFAQGCYIYSLNGKTARRK